MSRSLQYPAKCADCGGLMRIGEEADFFKDDEGAWYYVHAGKAGCEIAAAPKPVPPTPRKLNVEELYDFRECSVACSTRWAFTKGYVPPACHVCGAAWLEDAA